VDIEGDLEAIAAKERQREAGGDNKSLKKKVKSKDRSGPRGPKRSGKSSDKLATKGNVRTTTITKTKAVSSKGRLRSGLRQRCSDGPVGRYRVDRFQDQPHDLQQLAPVLHRADFTGLVSKPAAIAVPRQCNKQFPRHLAIKEAGIELRGLAYQRIPLVDQQLDRWRPAMTATVDRSGVCQLDGAKWSHARRHLDEDAATMSLPIMLVVTKPPADNSASAPSRADRRMPVAETRSSTVIAAIKPCSASSMSISSRSALAAVVSV
jgi:hypothetical protein